MSKIVNYNSEIPYNNLPLLPPQAEIESTTILKKTIAASRALSELKGAITNLPNPTLFIDTINLQEAQASSAIENIITTQDELFKASIAEKKNDNPATKEVMHYKDALWFGVEQIENRPILTTNLFIAIMQIIKENQSSIRNAPGTQLKNPATNSVVYTPPEGENVIREKLKKDGIELAKGRLNQYSRVSFTCRLVSFSMLPYLNVIYPINNYNMSRLKILSFVN